MKADDVLRRLDNVKRRRENEWMATCPAHADINPSLHVTAGRDGTILLKCFAGCPIEDVVAAIDLDMGDLFDGERPRDWRWQPPIQRTWSVPTPPPAATVSPKVERFFADRGIGVEALDDWGVSGTDEAIHFPYRTADGSLVNVKHRYPGKRFAMEPGCELIFWGIDRCRGAQQVAVVEGEMDALSLAQVGIPHVLSVPNGGAIGQMDYFASGESVFDACHTVILAGDADDTGRALMDEVSRRVGKAKCYRAVWPDGCKDANDVLVSRGAEALRVCIANAEPVPIEGIATPGQLLANTIARYRTGPKKGASTGWRSLDNLITFRPGQVTVFSGVPGSGKSEVVDCITLALAKAEGWFCGVFSPENYPIDLHLAKYAEKWIGKPFYDGPTPRMTEDDLSQFHAWADGFLGFVNPDEVRGLDDILDATKAMIARYGLRGLVIDPWNRIEHLRPKGMSETDYIGESLSRIQWFARSHDVHVFLVVHPRIMRRDDDGRVPIVTPYDLHGSAHWFNMSDNIVVVHRHKDDATKPVEVHVQKVRFRELGKLGAAHLAFDTVCGSYRDTGHWETA